MTRAIVVRELGGPEVLRPEDRDPGAPDAGQVRVRVTAVGVNFIDVYFRTGLYPRPLPFVAGVEGAGEVEAVGDGVPGLAQGDRVAWASVPGSYAEALVAPAGSLVPLPDGVPCETAAAVMLQGMTAHYLAHSTRETRPGDAVLVHAAAGGTGLLLVQTLKGAGARVIGTCSTDDKAKLAREAGCDRVTGYGPEEIRAAARDLTEGRGVDAVYDSVGAATFDASLSVLRPRGLLVSFGQSSGAVPPVDVLRLQVQGSVYLTRPSLAHYTASRPELEERAAAVLGAVAAGRLRVRVAATFPLDRAGDAHRALEGRATSGKIVLVP